MAGSAVLAISIIADARQARREIDQFGNTAEKSSSRLSKLTAPAGAVIAGLGLLGKAALDSASELQQSTGAVQSVFGKYSSTIIKHAKAAAGAVGLSQSAFQTQATLLGSQLKNLGAPMGSVAGATTALIKKAADLAATFGGPTSDAVAAISSLMRGESDPIEAYGVSINQAAIQSFILAKGLKTSTDAQIKASKRTAILALLNKQTAAATGQFAREAHSAAGAAEIQAAKLENARAALGQKLLPVYAKFKSILADVFGWVTRNSDIVFTLAGVIAAAAAAVLIVNGAIRVWTATVKAFTVVQRILNFVLAQNPILRIVIVIAALVAALVIAYKKSETFRSIVNAAFRAVMAVVRPIARFFAHDLPAAIKTIVGALRNTFRAVVDFLKTWGPRALLVLFPFIGIPLLIAKHFGKIVGWLRGIWDNVLGGARNFVSTIVSTIAGIPGRLLNSAGAMLSAGKRLIGAFFSGIADGAKAVGSWAQDAARSLVNAIITGLNTFLHLPWVLKIHIAIPLAPDIDVGPYTIMPSIPLWASQPPPMPAQSFARPAIGNVRELRPGFTLFAAGDTWPATLNVPRGRAGAAVVETVRVEFTGLITDPDGVARAIEELLDRRRRRIGAA